MAKPETDLDKEIQAIVRPWVVVNRVDDPMEYEAWRKWRAEEMNSFIEPDNFTVPSQFPPTTVAGARDYFEAVRKIRASIGWKNQAAKLPPNPSAWLG